MARGGYRASAPQNNPMKVNATGGNGQSGNPTSAAQWVPQPGFGEATALYNDQVAGNAAVKSIEQTQATPTALQNPAASQPIIPLDAPTTMPNEPVTAGADAGPGPGMAALGLLDREQQQEDTYRAQIAAYMPALLRVAANPNTSTMTRMIIRKLRDQV